MKDDVLNPLNLITPHGIKDIRLSDADERIL